MTHQTSKDTQSSPRRLFKFSEAKAAIHQARKDKLTANYGFEGWTDASPEALLELQPFLPRRMEARQ